MDEHSIKELDSRFKENASSFDIELGGVNSRLDTHEERLNEMIRKLVSKQPLDPSKAQ